MRLWHRQESKSVDIDKPVVSGQWLFYLIAAIGVLISILLWRGFVSETEANLEHLVQLQTDHVASDIELQFELRIAALKNMAKHLQTAQATSYNNWQDVVEYVDDYGGFQAIAWLDQQLKPQWVNPNNNPTVTNNIERLAGHFGPLFETTAIHKQIWISPSFAYEAQPTKKYILAVAPFISPLNHQPAYLVAAIDMEKAFDLHLNSADYTITILYEGQKVVQNGPNIALKTSFYEKDLHFLGTNWQMFVQPSPRLAERIQTNLPYIALLLGVCIALLFAIASRLAQISQARAKSLHQANIDLKREISERMQAEETKRRLERALLQGQKLQAIGTLAGGIAHDFNNLLYAIIGYVEMAREDVPPESLVYDNLGKVLEASQRGRDLISRILAFGRRQQHQEYKSMPLRTTIESVLALLAPTIPASVHINYEVEKDLQCNIMGDQTQLHQVMVNIINNSVDAMDGEGTISIRLNHISSDDDLLKQFPEISQSNYCKIEITDTGHGMDPTTIERIFEPFFTTKEVGKGTGLGLATVHAIIKEHQGNILVTSRLGHGSTFTIFLPQHTPT